MTPRQFARRLERLADDSTREELAELLGKEALKLYRQEFSTKIDPRGVSWAPRRWGKGRKGVGKRSGTLLVDTHALEREMQLVGVNKNGFTISSPTPYSGFIHGGTVKMPRRRIVPVRGEGLGIWAEPLQKVARDFIRFHLEGK